jgi:curved DNA-binding protein CbpA
MDGRTYYMILGVPRTESPGGIRSAYRDLAKKMHPDVAGEHPRPRAAIAAIKQSSGR